jgi:membrane protease YdiL (CAAX protease family)
MTDLATTKPRSERLVIAFALLYPTLLTYVYFISLANVPEFTQQVVYGVGKAIQFALPILWVGFVCREQLRWPKFSTNGLAAGILFGLVVGATMVALYFGWFKHSGEFAAGAAAMKERLAKIGVYTGAVYAIVALFYSLVHSLLEEYYWRWFVFGRLRKLVPLWPAILVSALGFMAHHVIVLATYFGWGSFWTWLFSLSTAFGGAVWAWLYNRSGSIYGPWTSHLLIDAAVFGIGYDLMQSAAS